ncbi:hypothetical protein STXM2123_1883 [Streptomyces sp. F-3]|nr:hypothetical protein STXM2123_1883 [Streptomyces sp. F-3]
MGSKKELLENLAYSPTCLSFVMISDQGERPGRGPDAS